MPWIACCFVIDIAVLYVISKHLGLCMICCGTAQAVRYTFQLQATPVMQFTHSDWTDARVLPVDLPTFVLSHAHCCYAGAPTHLQEQVSLAILWRAQHPWL